MSTNEFLNKEESEKIKAIEEVKKPKRKKKSETKSVKTGGSTVVQIMNGEFLSKDWFLKNLNFTFYIGFLMVVLIGWGYYTETVIKNGVNLKTELSELESEFFTLNSEYIAKRGRDNLKENLAADGPKENRISPHKLKVKNFVFD
ncbi:MAG: hypothetical protein ACI857_002460 [Arenicella sp.]|jgi:hypothetical protein